MTKEQAFLDQIISIIGQPKNLYAGIGQDCAIIKTNTDIWQVFTCDTQLEGTHFKLLWTTAEQLGRKAAVVNISDIAAVGGIPKYCLVSLGLPSKISQQFIKKIYIGLKKEFDPVGVNIIGGNIVKSDKLFIDITLIGEIQKENIVLRSGAKINDLIAVTGTLGDASQARMLLKKNIINKKLSDRFLLPNHRLKAGQILAKNKLVSAMMDISDGLSTDLITLCNMSKVGAQIDIKKLPVSNELKKYKNYFATALSGGEDYELLFTFNPKNLTKIGQVLKNTRFTIIGKITDNGFNFKNSSWNHFSR